MHMQNTMAKRSVKQLFSTGDIRTLIGIKTPKTVADWIDKGVLKGVRFPGHSERRVHRDELKRFLKEYDYVWALRELDIEEGLIRRELPPLPPLPPHIEEALKAKPQPKKKPGPPKKK